MAPRPPVSMPGLRALLGFLGLSKTSRTSAVRSINYLQGGQCKSDYDVRDVVNMLIDSLDEALFNQGGTTSQVLLGTGAPGNVPPAALPAPSAGVAGGVALPAASTGLTYTDAGTWARAGGAGELLTAVATVGRGSDVTLNVDSTGALVVGKVYRISDGTHRMTFTVKSITDATHFVATAWAASGDVSGTLAIGATIWCLARVTLITAVSNIVAIPDGDVDVTVALAAGGPAVTVKMQTNPVIDQTVAVLQPTDASTYNTSIDRNGSTMNGASNNPAVMSTDSPGGASPGTTASYVFTCVAANAWRL